MSQNGKGSTRRPSQVPTKVVEENWDRVFKKNPLTELTELTEELAGYPELEKDEQQND